MLVNKKDIHNTSSRGWRTSQRRVFCPLISIPSSIPLAINNRHRCYCAAAGASGRPRTVARTYHSINILQKSLSRERVEAQYWLWRQIAAVCIASSHLLVQHWIAGRLTVLKSYQAHHVPADTHAHTLFRWMQARPNQCAQLCRLTDICRGGVTE